MGTFQTAEDLRNVRTYIAEHGWCQKRTRDGRTGAVCLMGGIYGSLGAQFRDGYVSGGMAPEHLVRAMAIRNALEVYLGLSAAGPVTELPNWNDSRERTFDEVLDVLEKTAIQVEEVVEA